MTRKRIEALEEIGMGCGTGRERLDVDVRAWDEGVSMLRSKLALLERSGVSKT